VIRARYVPVGWLINGQRVGLSAVKGPVDVAAGVADPSGFLCALLKLGLEVRSFTDVGDHGPLVRISERCVVTEKDAARLPLDTDAMALLMDLEVEGGDVLLGAIQRLREPVW
jgi:tetraacyldisaccharide-1-P 4'-kinase